MRRLTFSTALIFGEKPLDYLKQFKGRRIFIVCDPFMVSSGLLDQVTARISDCDVYIFSQITPDPSIELVAEGVSALRAFAPDLLIAFGGGSALDAAKAFRHFADEAGGSHIEFIAIPTTSGTGSEVTSFAVITDKQKGVKYPLVSEKLLPDTAILDWQLVRSVPAQLVADTGMDVLTHALEAYVSTKATDFSDALAEKATVLVFGYLHQAYRNGDDEQAKTKMHHASTLAGMAFNEASLGLNHALAHVIGGQLGIPHGRINSILLPHVVLYNADFGEYGQKDFSLAAQKYAHLARLAGLGGASVRSSVRNLVGAIVKLQKLMKMPQTLNQCHLETMIDSNMRTTIAQLALKDNCLLTNPRPANEDDVQRVLQQII